MGGLKHLALVLAGFAAAAATGSPADAQCRLCEQPTTATPEQAPGSDVDLQVEANLNFDRLILMGAGVGAATLRPDGSSATEGSVMQMGPRAMVGSVQVHGQPNRAVRVDLPRRIDLFSISGARMTLDDVTTDLTSAPHLDAAGNLSFRFGGRLIVSGDADGPEDRSTPEQRLTPH
jgi:hypothetical protein